MVVVKRLCRYLRVDGVLTQDWHTLLREVCDVHVDGCLYMYALIVADNSRCLLVSG